MPVRLLLPAVVPALTASLSTPAAIAQTPNLVADIKTLPADAGFDTAVRVGNRVFFIASTDCTGMELRVSDGTPAGTRLATDAIRPGGSSAYPYEITPLGDRLVFGAYGATTAYELWSVEITDIVFENSFEVGP